MTQAADVTRCLRLGLIGTGLAVERLHWPVLAHSADRFQVVGFADPSREQAERFASFSGLGMGGYTPDHQALLARDDVEAVLVTVPIPLLYGICREALEAGKHVLCEKPAGRDEEEGRSFLQLPARHPGQVLLMAENLFYRDDVRLARSILDEGGVGRLHLTAWRHVSRNVPIPGRFSSTPWRQRPAYRGGAHLDAGVHHIAQIRTVCGDVTALHGVTQRANRTIDAPSDLALNLTFSSGAVGNYTASYAEVVVPPEPNEMRLYGTEGTLIVGGGMRERKVVLVRDGECEVHRFEGVDNGYFAEIRNFYEAIVDGEPVVGTVAQSFENLLVIMRALDSAEQGRALPVESGLANGGGGVPLWRPGGAGGLFDGLPGRHRVERVPARAEAAW